MQVYSYFLFLYQFILEKNFEGSYSHGDSFLSSDFLCHGVLSSFLMMCLQRYRERLLSLCMSFALKVKVLTWNWRHVGTVILRLTKKTFSGEISSNVSFKLCHHPLLFFSNYCCNRRLWIRCWSKIHNISIWATCTLSESSRLQI